ncbi:MAG: hypothetical protein WDZ76_07745 [Pseudohongiellaceae bacterium]
MKNSALITTVFLILVHAGGSIALVEPEEADITTADWMARLMVYDVYDGSLREFCKGSLIDPYWVLTSSYCFNDPNDIIENATDSFPPYYMIGLGDDENHYEIEERIASPGGDFYLVRLAKKATQEPIAFAALTTGELLGKEVRVYNDKVTAAVGNFFYNPDSDNEATCSIDGHIFYVDGRYCFILPDVATTDTLQMAVATVLDPHGEDAPQHPLNDYISASLDSTVFYLDHRQSGSYFCHEDMGSALVAEINGELTQIGVVMAVGKILQVPMCNSSYYNFSLSLTEIEDFIASTLIRGQFDQNCPGATHFHWSLLETNDVHINWHEVEDAVGYRVFFTTRRGYEPIQTLELANITEVTTTLAPGIYSLAIQAFNADCAGNLSPVTTIEIPQ